MIRRFGWRTVLKNGLLLLWLATLWVVFRAGEDTIVALSADRPSGPVPVAIADLRRPPRGVMLGIYIRGVPEETKLLTFTERRVGRTFPLVSVYQPWGDQPRDQFDVRHLNEIVAHGAVPVVTWEPWVTDFSGRDLPPMQIRQLHNLRAIASGKYDAYIIRWAEAAKRWRYPLMVRLGQENNANWYPWGFQAYGNTAADWVAMWRHVVEIFRRVGATNVIWVWSPARLPFHDTYPGARYVDWVGTTVLNFGTVPPGWHWGSFDTLFGPWYRKLAQYHKPIMIAEVASAEQGGSKARWITGALRSLRTKYPDVHAFVWFDEPQDRYWPINWSLASSEAATRAFRRAVVNPYFMAKPYP